MGPLQELLRAGYVLLGCTTGRWIPTVRWIEDKFSRISRWLGRRPTRLAMKAGYFILRSYRSLSDQLRDSAGTSLAPRRVSEFERQPRPLALGFITAFAKNRALRLFSKAVIRLLRPRTSCTSFPQYKDFGVDDVPSRGLRIAAINFQLLARLTAGALGHNHDLRPLAWRLRPKQWAWQSLWKSRCVVCDIQRGRGHRLGFPPRRSKRTCWQALFGRNSEAPIPICRGGNAE